MLQHVRMVGGCMYDCTCRQPDDETRSDQTEGQADEMD